MYVGVNRMTLPADRRTVRIPHVCGGEPQQHDSPINH